MDVKSELSSSYVAKICIIRLHIGQTSKAKYSNNLPNRAHWKKSTITKKLETPGGNQPTLLVI